MWLVKIGFYVLFFLVFSLMFMIFLRKNERRRKLFFARFTPTILLITYLSFMSASFMYLYFYPIGLIVVILSYEMFLRLIFFEGWFSWNKKKNKETVLVK